MGVVRRTQQTTWIRPRLSSFSLSTFSVLATIFQVNLGYPVPVGFLFHFFPLEPPITKEPFLQWNISFDDKWHMFRTGPLPVNSVELLKGRDSIQCSLHGLHQCKLRMLEFVTVCGIYQPGLCTKGKSLVVSLVFMV